MSNSHSVQFEQSPEKKALEGDKKSTERGKKPHSFATHLRRFNKTPDKSGPSYLEYFLDLTSGEPFLGGPIMQESHGYRVYVVEDDLELSTILDRVLKSIDADVQLHWAKSAEEAMNHLEQKKNAPGQQPYDLIIADIFLEGSMSGLEFWKLCQKVYPEIPLVVTSGMPTDRFLSAVGTASVCPPFLPKPFSVGECRQMLSGMLSINKASETARAV